MERSQFIRDAIKEKLERAGIAVPPDAELPPVRGEMIVAESAVKQEQTGGKGNSQKVKNVTYTKPRKKK